MATGFLKGGARNVIGSLWPVREAVVQRLEQAYYERWPENPARALQESLLELRVSDASLGLADWAAFYCQGAG
jgi:CHAT domain-containing protein